MEIVPTPGEVVLSKGKLLVMSSGVGGSTCRRTKTEGWSRDQLAVFQRAWEELPTNSLSLILSGSWKEELACKDTGMK